MHDRDVTRGSIKNARSTAERSILQDKYRTLRNKVTSKIREDNKDFNNNRVIEAKNESELWKIASEVTNPKKENEWLINIEGKEVKDEKEIADAFNVHFIEKIVKLKEGIDKSIVVDPLEKLEKKLKHNTKKFNLKAINESELSKIMKKVIKKKSAGVDGLSQENLINGATNLIAPLTVIINKSISGKAVTLSLMRSGS